ncbi:Zinc finger protein [Oopsacas minuta]|uniref:Zinc finger protein n=1 Tax=Oopsacas minuta TaxID=111878 RepID=A0AAV7JS90_9METZ|nr:Zinc finger protein [Oopsacas minuta]
MLEIGDTLQIDGHKLWQEYTGYKSFVQSLPMPWSVEVAVHVMHSPPNRETMAVAYPLISNILGRIAVLPASSAQVEILFSTMKRIKSAQRNRLKSKTLDHLMRISIEGPSIQNWDPYPALKKGNLWVIDEYRFLDLMILIIRILVTLNGELILLSDYHIII